ncbi:MAG: 3-keto-disaccharide hydrolase, partial [Pyrinomonadaceae bacterium]
MKSIAKRLHLCFVVVLLTSSVLAQSKPNSLSPKEISEGWILLWDGETTFGWQSHGKAEWKIADDVISASSGDSGWLGTATPFGDFVLKADFRTGPDGNSGIFLRSASEGEPHKTGYELQIFDEHKEYKTGSLVNYLKAKTVKTTPNQWHTFEVRAEGDLFVVKLDGKTLINARDKSHSVGHIGLQYNKDKRIEFRNLKLKPLGLNSIFNEKD